MSSEQEAPLVLKFKPVTDHISRLISDVQYQVMQARLVPVEQVFARFPRLVRDLGQQLNKKLSISITGGDIELDRTLVDKLGEPLVHLIKNSIDHGILSEGNIKLSAKREKSLVLISLEDDGQGINWDKVEQAALKRNIISQHISDKEELKKLIFHPQLSTKDEVTQTSGRGVGLSVVKDFVDHVGGKVIVKSPLESGGTSFVLELPLTLAIISALLVSSADETFAIPFSSIERSVEISEADIKSMGDQDVAVVSGQEVPLIRLNHFFNLSSLNLPKQTNESATSKPENLKNNQTIVLMKSGQETVGIVVDKLISQQEIIVKPLASVLQKAQGFSGSTILGDGKSILILDINSLLEDPSQLIRKL